MLADRTAALALSFAVVLGIAAGAREARAQATPDYAALIAAPDRSEADREADKRRDPLPLLKFAAPRPGMKVLDMGAGGGYSTELMARAVAPNGKVYGQFPADGFQKAIDNFNARLKTPAMSDAAADFRPFDDPISPDMSNLDLITFLFYYHDTTYMKVDREQMDRKMFAALKPGGILVLADHSAAAGADIRSASRCIASTRRSCARSSKRRASSSSPKAISGACPAIPATSPATGRRRRSIPSC